MFGIHNSQRIVAQRGVFVLFGGIKTPMDELYGQRKYKINSLKKLLIPKAVIPNLTKILMKLGYGDSLLYPGLSGLGKELKRTFFWRGFNE